jgi:hypothetical protein
MVKTILLLLCLSSVASAQVSTGRKLTSWTIVTGGPVQVDGRSGSVEVYVAPESIRRKDNGDVRAWITAVFPAGSGFMTPGTNFGETRFDAFFQCGSIGKSHVEAMIVYDRSGQELFAGDYTDKSQEVSGTIGHSVYEWLCERDPAKTSGPPVLKTKLPNGAKVVN